MWKPPADQVETVSDNGWRPPANAVESTPPVDPTASFPEVSAVANSNQGNLGKAWDLLQVPSQMAGRGLKQLASYHPTPEPTGNLPLDMISGAPKIAIDTMAEAAPKFVNRASILTAGAASALRGAVPLVKAVMRGGGAQAESLTGAVPGSLEAAYKDATLMTSPGKGAAGASYEAGKAEMGTAESIFKGMYKPEEIVDKAKEYLGQGGRLEPAEALTYRKAVDVLAKSGRYVKDELFAMRDEADAAVKASQNMASGDAAFQRGRYADSLRNLLPQNKYGGTSAFKLGIMAMMEQLGMPGKLALAAMSPAAAGVAATGAGIASRVAGPVVTNPAASVALRNLLEEYAARRNKQ